MAKAVPIRDDIPEDDAQAWLAEVLRVRFDEILTFTDTALDASQTDGVHGMRVASRRLRGILRDFDEPLKKSPFAGFNKSLKKLADTLGKVRDLDVLIEELQAFGTASDSERILSTDANDSDRKGIEQIAAEYKEQRAKAHRQVSDFLTGEYILNLRTQFAAAIEAAFRQRDLFKFSDIRGEGERIVAGSLKDFRAKSDALYHPNAERRLHKLRIAGKRLRYAIELFAPHFGDDIKPFAKEIKKMQSHLGGIHDCDVWIEEISKLAVQKRKTDKQKIKTRAAMWLISEFTRRRTKAYRSALELWSKWETEGFCERLDKVVS